VTVSQGPRKWGESPLPVPPGGGNGRYHTAASEESPSSVRGLGDAARASLSVPPGAVKGGSHDPVEEGGSGLQTAGGRRAWVWILWVLLGLLMVRELYDPYLLLLLGDLVLPKRPPLMLSAAAGDASLGFALYEDARPHIGKIAALQKGLVLVRDGKLVVEEGYGFGLPLVAYGDLVHNSRHAEVVQLDGRMLVKRYRMDVADRWSRFLRTKYKDIAPLGTVVVTYTLISPTVLHVDVDFTGLTVDWHAAYLMNEQGARAFPVYEDSRGERRHGDEIGIWHPDDDPFGCWLSSDEALRFCVETEPGRSRYVGRERYIQYNWVRLYGLSWSGIDIEVEAPLDHYRYTVRVEALDGR
jgi:hypothetical protein